MAFNADIIVFPELSITNYEPTLATDLAIDITDARFSVFEELSDKNNITIAMGVPLKQPKGTLISLLIFKPNKKRSFYAKQILHEDELPYFISGTEQVYNTIKKEKLAFAICYESMIEAHFLNTFKNNSSIYITSVAKNEEGVVKGYSHYKYLSATYKTTIIMVNAIGKADTFINAGQSCVFKNGQEILQLSKTQEEILLFDTAFNTAEKYNFSEIK